MANLTLAVDDALLARARAKAAERGTSVNAVVRESLERFAGPSEAAAALRTFFSLSDAAHTSMGPEGITWTREQLYDRADLR